MLSDRAAFGCTRKRAGNLVLLLFLASLAHRVLNCVFLVTER